MKRTADDSTVMSVHAQIKYKKVLAANLIKYTLFVFINVFFTLSVCVGRRQRLYRKEFMAGYGRILRFPITSPHVGI